MIGGEHVWKEGDIYWVLFELNFAENYLFAGCVRIFIFVRTWDDYYFFSSSSSSLRFSPFPFFSYLFHLYLFYEVIFLLILKTKYEGKNLTTLLKVWNVHGISKLGFFFWKKNKNYLLNRKYCINNKHKSKFLLFKCMICSLYLYLWLHITIYIQTRTWVE